MKIDLDSSYRCLAPCKYCGSLDGASGPGTAVHAARIVCAQDECGRFLNWMPFWMAERMGLIELVACPDDLDG